MGAPITWKRGGGTPIPLILSLLGPTGAPSVLKRLTTSEVERVVVACVENLEGLSSFQL